MEVLICKEEGNIIKNIPVSGVSEVLGSEKYTQRVVIPKAGYRICIWYSEDNKGIKRTIRLSDGEKITVRGTYIICHEEYGAYKDITLDDIGDFLVKTERKQGTE